ncbi:hypothetical protein WJX82_008145 [Trebouxia sp. C0006]
MSMSPQDRRILAQRFGMEHDEADWVLNEADASGSSSEGSVSSESNLRPSSVGRCRVNAGRHTKLRIWAQASPCDESILVSGRPEYSSPGRQTSRRHRFDLLLNPQDGELRPATPLPATAPLPIRKSPSQLSTQSRIYPDSSPHAARKDVCHVRADASSQKSGRRGHESPQAVLDLILDDLESDALSSPDDIVYQFSRDSASIRRSDSFCPPRQARGRCSSIGSMSLLDSMQLMEVPILPEEDGSVADEYVDNKLDEGAQ